MTDVDDDDVGWDEAVDDFGGYERDCRRRKALVEKSRVLVFLSNRKSGSEKLATRSIQSSVGKSPPYITRPRAAFGIQNFCLKKRGKVIAGLHAIFATFYNITIIIIIKKKRENQVRNIREKECFSGH